MSATEFCIIFFLEGRISIMEWFISQIPGVFIGVLIGLTVNYLWYKYIGLQNKKERVSEKKQLIASAIAELDYNMKPGVGCPKCHFQLVDIKKYLNNASLFSLDEAEIKIIRKLIHDAELCNSYGGIQQLGVPPGSVKTQCSNAKELISNQEYKA